jgi:hypothetical protein
MILRAVVMGPPLTYGNKRAFSNRKTGGMVVVERNSANLRTWQDAIRQAMLEDADRALLGKTFPLVALTVKDGDSRVMPRAPLAAYVGAVHLEVSYYLARPKGHYRKNGTLSPRAPAFPTKKPDADKLARAVADCGTGIWYRDDGQIVEWKIRKCYADGPNWSGVERTVVEAYLPDLAYDHDTPRELVPKATEGE